MDPRTEDAPVTPEDDGGIEDAPLSFVIKKEFTDYDVLAIESKGPQEICPQHGFSRAIKSKLLKRRVTCSICHKHLANSTTLKKHLRIHSDERPYQCNHCQRRFRQKEHCEKHSRIHSRRNGYECLVCTMTFGRRHFLVKHMLVCHNTDILAQPSLTTQVRRAPALPLKPNVSETAPVRMPKAESRCGICGKVFKQSYNLKRHIRTQHEEPSYKCKVCAKVFKRASGLRTHELTHAGVTPFRCELCGRCFTQKHHLTRHKGVHLPKNNLISSICKKGLRYASSFLARMAIHDSRNGAEQRPLIGEEMICYGTPGATLHRSPFLQSQFVLFEPSDMKCMFCDVTLPGPEHLHDHLVDHCEQILAENGGLPRDGGTDDEILGL